ncbi:MAG: type IX secretion system membrane protein PorP/SprF [Crocinitomicaceae bacterium]
MKRIVTISVIVLLSFKMEAQQQHVFTNFLMNDYYYNPAIAGSKDVHYANIGFRSQWVGFDDAPVTIYGNYYGSIKNKRKHGYGISIVNDRSGLVSNTGFLLNYAYHVKLGEKVRLGMGIRPGYQQYNIRLYDAQLADANDNVLSSTGVLSTGALDLSAGLNLYSDKFFVMMSMRHILGAAIEFTGFNDGLSKHYTVIGGYKWLVNGKKKVPLDEDGKPIKKKKDFELMPVLMVNYVAPLTPQGSVMLRATYDKKYWLGLTYRTEDAVGVSLGVKLKNRLTIGYAFDYSLGAVKTYNSGTHEIMLSFQTTSKKPSLDEQDEELNNSIFEENKKKDD